MGDSSGPLIENLFSAAVSYPAHGQSTMATLVLGTTEGQLLVVSGLSGDILVNCVHPRSNRTRQSRRGSRRRLATPQNFPENSFLSPPDGAAGSGNVRASQNHLFRQRLLRRQVQLLL